VYAAVAKARLQAFDQRRHRLAASALAALAEQARRTPWQCFRRLGSQADRLDSGRQLESLQALDKYREIRSRCAWQR
jgi:hypothetical protein